MIGANEDGRVFLEHTLSSWTAAENFDSATIEKYREAYCNEEKIHTFCEDYRTGAFFDRVYDEEELERGRKIEVPVLAVWGWKRPFRRGHEERRSFGSKLQEREKQARPVEISELLKSPWASAMCLWHTVQTTSNHPTIVIAIRIRTQNVIADTPWTKWLAAAQISAISFCKGYHSNGDQTQLSC